MKKVIVCVLTAAIIAAAPAGSNALGKAGFSGVKETDWYYDTVTEIASRGIINGYAFNVACSSDMSIKQKDIPFKKLRDSGISSYAGVCKGDSPLPV